MAWRFVRSVAAVMASVLILLTAVTATVTGSCNFTPLIESQVREHVLLRCCFDASLGLQDLTLDWKKVGLREPVHVYRHGKDDFGPQMERYANRTALNHEALPKGIMELHIFNVQLLDSGEYECYVRNGPKNKRITLEVGDRQQNKVVYRSTTRSPEEEESSKPDAGNKNVGVFVGPTVGVCVCVVVLVILRKLKRCRRKMHNKKTDALQLDKVTPLTDENCNQNISAPNDSEDDL